jgi:catechol 2,3-dioxygenase-like lactoylglutathione lyase family enzyme
MEIVGLDHVAILSGDVERSRAFYGGVLGMQEVPRPASFSFPGAWFRQGRAEVHVIGEAEPGRAADAHPGYRADEHARGYATHVAFEVADLDAARAHLESRGVSLVGQPRPRGDGPIQMYVADPDGYVVELFAWPKPGGPTGA